MSGDDRLPESVRALIGGASQNDQLDGFALHAIVRAADDNGVAQRTIAMTTSASCE